MTDEVSKEGKPEHDRREDTGDSTGDVSRSGDRSYLDEFEKIFAEGDEVGGSEKHSDNEERPSEERDNWSSEYDSYEEW
jgi:hypothetical protein